MKDIVLNLYVVDATRHQYLPKLLETLQQHFNLRHTVFDTAELLLHAMEGFKPKRQEFHVAVVAYQPSRTTQNVMNGLDLLEGLRRANIELMPVMLAEAGELEFNASARGLGAMAVVTRGETLNHQLLSVLLRYTSGQRVKIVRRQLISNLTYFILLLVVFGLSWLLLKNQLG